MIGQEEIRKWIDKNINKLPHFIVFIGDKGSGKRTLAKYIAEKLGATYTEIGVKVDDVREVVDTATMSATKVLYCFADADTMKPQAKNAMLKITEEAPDNAYFVLTVQNEGTLLDTIKSRAIVYKMAPYSVFELKKYADSKNYDVFIGMTSTPYEVDMLYAYGQEFIDYAHLVLENIAIVEPANAFKSSMKLAIKNEEGYDLKMFLQTMRYMLLEKLIESEDADDNRKYASACIITDKHIGKLENMSANKQQVYDSWVFAIREALI